MDRRKQIPLIRTENYLGRFLETEFFKSIPESPGVYFFKDEAGRILYVGKAKNLKKRINSYRQIRAGRSSRKLVRLTYFTRKIDWEITEDETNALLRENYYLRNLKPEYNRMNTRPEFYFYLLMREREKGKKLNFEFVRDLESEAKDCEEVSVFGAFKSKNRNRRNLGQLLGLYLCLQEKDIRSFRYPHFLYLESDQYRLSLDKKWKKLKLLKDFLAGRSKKLIDEARKRLEKDLPECGLSAFQLREALETSEEFYERLLKRNWKLLQDQDSDRSYLLKEEVDDALVRTFTKLDAQTQPPPPSPSELSAEG